MKATLFIFLNILFTLSSYASNGGDIQANMREEYVLAFKNEDVVMAKKLLSFGLDVHASFNGLYYNSLFTMLFHNIAREQIEVTSPRVQILDLLLAEGVDINVKTEYISPLRMILSNGVPSSDEDYESCVTTALEYLNDRGADMSHGGFSFNWTTIPSWRGIDSWCGDKALKFFTSDRVELKFLGRGPKGCELPAYDEKNDKFSIKHNLGRDTSIYLFNYISRKYGAPFFDEDQEGFRQFLDQICPLEF